MQNKLSQKRLGDEASHRWPLRSRQARHPHVALHAARSRLAGLALLPHLPSGALGSFVPGVSWRAHLQATMAVGHR